MPYPFSNPTLSHVVVTLYYYLLLLNSDFLFILPIHTILFFPDKIISESKNHNIFVKKLDLSSLKSVREFAADVNNTESRLDVLIHNAGMANTFRKQKTEDGLEITMATNQFGPFLLTHLLIGKLRSTNLK